MTVEAMFRQWEEAGYTFPERGQRIEWRRRGETAWTSGTVDFCWAGVEPVIKLTTPPGAPEIHLHVGTGDEWRPV